MARSNSPASVFDMFSISDRAAYIRSLQRMLSLPTTGRISEVMRAKIKRLQRERGYPESGFVDYDTHLMIKEAFHLEKRRQKLARDILPNDFGDGIAVINRELTLLISLYGLSLRPPRHRAFGYDTVKAVERLRAIYSLPHSQIIDAELYDRMKRDIMSMSANNKANDVG